MDVITVVGDIFGSESPHGNHKKKNIYIYFSINSALHPFQDYFSSYETGQSVGEPREKPHGTPASRTSLVSHVASAGLEINK